MPDALATAVTNTDDGSCVDAYCVRIGKPWTLSAEGYRFIAVLESGILNGKYKGIPIVDGFFVQVYDDGFGIPTVGLGHKVISTDKLKLGDTITVERAKEFLSIDLSPVEAAINREVMVALHQYEYDALVSILFNSGIYRRDTDPWTGTRSEYLANNANKGDYKKMTKIIEAFVAHRVLGRRRTEARLFERGDYVATH